LQGYNKKSIGGYMDTYESPSVKLVKIVMAGGCCKSFKDDDNSYYCELITPIISPLKK
jgi:hypothetical protein